MSLRYKLTLLYSLLAGFILLFYGLVVYTFVSVMLVDQIDISLTKTAQDLITNTRVNALGEVEIIRVPSLDVTSTIYLQIWDNKGRLKVSSINITRLGKSLDPVGLRIQQPVFHDTKLNDTALRVLSVPLVVDGRKMAVLQVGTNRGIVDLLQQILVTVLGISMVIFVTLAGLAGWLSTGQALAPLENVTDAALSITNADDLSRRIPNPGKEKNEIGVLIDAFNQTLDRLEYLFNKQKRFMADVSHELRTPLTVIKGNVGLLRMMKKPDEESLKSIETEVDRLTRMVGDLLLLAQAEAGKLELDLQPVELDTVLLEVLQQVKILAGDRISLKLTEIDQIQVIGDRDRLKQVYINLLANAVKYTPAGGNVFLAIKKIGDQAQTVIEDTGPGIPAKDLPHIFERFYRGDKARTRSTDGSSFGLGLSIAYWIIKNHGGRIEVKSKEGSGTTFSVWLPLAGEKLIN
jgi:two-component system, OmpR family, sensor kinase